jgi:hypothetical protein
MRLAAVIGCRPVCPAFWMVRAMLHCVDVTVPGAAPSRRHTPSFISRLRGKHVRGALCPAIDLEALRLHLYMGKHKETHGL